jgi:phage shock protein PspC (stress-responsive transcriptional regulator)
MADQRLTRPVQKRMIAGVCAGLANYLGVDRALVRIAFVLAFFLGLSASFWIYLVLWLVMPESSEI